MSQSLQVAEQQTGVVAAMARRFDMDPRAFEMTLRATVVPKECSKEQFAAFLLVAKEYDLNPITKEIYAFPSKGGIQPIVSIDGWMKLMNSHPQFDGIEFEDQLTDDGRVISITARVFRKDRSHPISVTEYLAECSRSTDPWKQFPRRMLRHKAAIQAARYAFGFSGIVEPDEAERLGVEAVVAPPIAAISAPAATTKAPVPASPQKAAAPRVETVAADAEDLRSPDEVLIEIENTLSGITDPEEARAIFDMHYANHPALAFPGDKENARRLLAQAIEAITA